MRPGNLRPSRAAKERHLILFVQVVSGIGAAAEGHTPQVLRIEICLLSQIAGRNEGLTFEALLRRPTKSVRFLVQDNLLLDMYLAPHVPALYTKIRNRALIQYFRWAIF